MRWRSPYEKKKFKPALVLACYGMADGIYLPLGQAETQAAKLMDEYRKAGAPKTSP